MTTICGICKFQEKCKYSLREFSPDSLEDLNFQRKQLRRLTTRNPLSLSKGERFRINMLKSDISANLSSYFYEYKKFKEKCRMGRLT